MPKFYIGQNVEIVANHCYHGYVIGQIVEIQNICGDDESRYYEAWGSNNGFWCITDDCAKGENE